MRYRFLTECFPFHPKLSIIGMQKLFIQSNSCLLSQVWHSKTLHSQWRNWKLFVYIEGNKCQNNIVNIHSRLYMHAMGVMQAQPSTLTHCCRVKNFLIFRRWQETHVSPTMRALHCSVDNSWYCSTYSSGADKPIENNTSLPIADYLLLDQLVQTGLWHLSTETLDVLRSSDARQLSLVGEHGHHPVTPVHQHRSVRVQADRVRHTQYLRHLDQN